MGRPLKKTKMAQGIVDVAADLVGKVAVTGYRPSGGSLVSSTTSYIISQRGSKLFKIWLEDSTTGVYELKAVAPASLANTSNQFCVQVILNDSTVAYVEKFYNRTIHYVTAAGAAGTCTYTLGTEASDEGPAGAGAGQIDVR